MALPNFEKSEFTEQGSLNIYRILRKLKRKTDWLSRKMAGGRPAIPLRSSRSTNPSNSGAPSNGSSVSAFTKRIDVVAICKNSGRDFGAVRSNAIANEWVVCKKHGLFDSIFELKKLQLRRTTKNETINEAN